jgi:hypothetical protein
MATIDAAGFAGYLCQSCGKYKWAKAAQDKWKQSSRSAYTSKKARQELADKGILPKSCVVSWKNCQRYLDDLSTKCTTERAAFKVDAENWLAEHGSVPEPIPTAGPDGWVYPASWKSVPGTADGSGVTSDGRELPTSIRERGRAMREERASTAVEESGTTSTTKVAIGLGIGALLLVGGLWWASRKKAERSQARRSRRDED